MDRKYQYPEVDASIDDIVLVSGSSTPELADRISDFLRIGLCRLWLSQFADGEVKVEFADNIRGREIYIVQSICRPVNKSLMELALIADAAKRSSATSISAVVPYLGYSRQDRRPRGDRTPISAKVVADILSVVGINRLVTIDLHAEQIQAYYNIPVENVYASPVLLGEISRSMPFGGKEGEGIVVIAPDVGGVARARAFARQLDADLAIIDKRRPQANVAEAMNVIGEIKGRHCVLIDDIVDTAGTLRVAADALLERGASSVRAYCTHPVLSGAAVDNVMSSGLSALVCTDTIPLTEEAASCDKIRQLSVAELLAETISRIQGKQSVGSLFMD